MHGKGVMRKSFIGKSMMRHDDDQMQSLREEISPSAATHNACEHGDLVPPMKTLLTPS